MDFFLLRHFESEKNVADTMSLKDEEKLTDKGRTQCVSFASKFKALCDSNNLHITSIESADSIRAKETAQIISKELQCESVRYWSQLRSTSAGILAGKSLEEIKIEDQFFYYHYWLYRKGVLNLYYMDNNWMDSQKESKKEFEERVMRVLLEITKDMNHNDSKLIVGHRSSITAILIEFARRAGFYPKDFYGSIDLSLGGLSWITVDKGDIEFKYVDEILL